MSKVKSVPAVVEFATGLKNCINEIVAGEKQSDHGYQGLTLLIMDHVRDVEIETGQVFESIGKSSKGKLADLVSAIRDNVEAPPVHGPKPSRPGNRRMATLACVYSVDPYVRTPEDVVAALFRDERPEDAPARPRPCHKRLTACFSGVEEAGTEDALRIRGDFRAWSWAAEQIYQRRAAGQVLVRLCDGQESLWRAADVCLGLDLKDDQQKRLDKVVDILAAAGM